MYSPSLIFKGHRVSLPEVKRPQSEVDRTPLFSAEVKNKWSYTYNPLIRLRGACKDNYMSAGVDMSLNAIPNPKLYRIKEDDRHYFKLTRKFRCKPGGRRR
jgi:hypothetical protein